MKVKELQEQIITVFPSPKIQSLNIFHKGKMANLEVEFYNQKDANEFETKCQKIAGNGKRNSFSINSEKTVVVGGLDEIGYKSDNISDSICEFNTGKLRIKVEYKKYVPNITLFKNEFTPTDM